MTRYLFGIFAVVFAFATVAFKTLEKKDTEYLYRFNSSADPKDQAQVQNRNNWDHVTGSQICPTNTNVKACEMKSTLAPVANKLPPSASISTALSGSSTYYVTAVTGGTAIFNTIP